MHLSNLIAAAAELMSRHGDIIVTVWEKETGGCHSLTTLRVMVDSTGSQPTVCVLLSPRGDAEMCALTPSPLGGLHLVKQ